MGKKNKRPRPEPISPESPAAGGRVAPPAEAGTGARWELGGAAARTVIGIVFLVSGLQKVFAAPEEFAAVIEGYRLLPPHMLLPFARVLPPLEVLVGLCLVTGYAVRAASVGAFAFFAMFIGALGSTALRGIPMENCGCFGKGLHLTRPQALTLDTILLCLSYLSWRFGTAYAPLEAWIRQGEEI